MKGIILAGGAGTRLYPLNQVASKQLLPVYDKPMIYYPLTVLILAGIREIMVISSPTDLPTFQRLMGDGSQWGIKLAYAQQESPTGLPQAFTIAEKWLNGEPSCLILGDNLFYGNRMLEDLRAAVQLKTGAVVFGYRVNDPSRYGVIEFNEQKKVTNIVEKPANPPSNYAVPGLYIVDGRAPKFSRNLKPSRRDETEIVDLLKCYLNEGSLSVRPLGRGITWLDMGTPSSLLKAGNYVEMIEQRQGYKIACPEEAAYSMKFLSKGDLLKLTDKMGAGEYASYLREVVLNTSPFVQS